MNVREYRSAIRQLEEEKTKYVLKAPETGSIIRFSGIKKGDFFMRLPWEEKVRRKKP
jgi:hypothetical protein